MDNGLLESNGSGNPRPLSARESCDRALDAMCVAAGWPKGFRPEHDHYPYPFSIHGSGSGRYYEDRNRRFGSPFMS